MMLLDVCGGLASQAPEPAALPTGKVRLNGCADERCRSCYPFGVRNVLRALAAQPSHPREQDAQPTLPVEIYGKFYDVPIAVQVHIVALESKLAEQDAQPLSSALLLEIDYAIKHGWPRESEERIAAIREAERARATKPKA